MHPPESTWTAASEAPLLARCRNPDTPVDELASMLADFPGEVLRNPAFKIATVADPSMVRRLPLHKQAVLALDAEYRLLTQSISDAPEIKDFVQFFNKYTGPEFRFQPTNPTRQIAYKPLMTDAPEAPPEELISAVRFVSALASAVASPYESREITAEAYRRAGRDYCKRGDLSCQAPREGGTEKPSREELPTPVMAVIASAFGSEAFFWFSTSDGGNKVDVDLQKRGYHVCLELVKSPRGKNVIECFEVDGRTPSSTEPARLLKAIGDLEALAPRRGQDEIVLVVGDTHYVVFENEIIVLSVSADDALGEGRIVDFRKLIAQECLEDVADELALWDAEPIQANESGISSALSELTACIDCQFEGRECEYQIAAFRGGKLVAYYGDKFEIEPPTRSRAWLRTSRPANQH